ncbi:MAG: prolyl oligopeptidase family serine peptidase [Gemmatimonadota bacterium]|nr:prolyl oligopeptidase family serine peptidase [Gemmatimonadota bacterium]
MSPKSLRALSLGALLTVLVPIALPTPVSSQELRPALEHEDTYRWNTIGGRVLSADGVWLAYVISPWEGDPTLVIARTDGTAERHFRGSRPVFTRDSRHVAFTVPPVEAVVDSLKLEGTGRDDLPGDSLAVVTLGEAFSSETDDAGVFRAGPIEGFEVPEDGGSWIAYHLSEIPKEEGEGEPEAEEAEEPAAEEGEEEEPEEEEESEEYQKWHKIEDGTPLVLRDLTSGSESTYEFVTSFAVAKSGDALAYSTGTEGDESDGEAAPDGVFIVDPSTGGPTAVAAGEGHYKRLAFDEAGTHLAFLSDSGDWEAERPAYALYRSNGNGAAALIADASTAGVPGGWWVSENGTPSFSEDGSRLFFGTAPRPAPEPDEKILDEDRVAVDIWNWKDDYLQPMQLVRAERERNRTYLAVHHDGANGIVQLGREDIPDVSRTETGAGDYVLGTSDLAYRQLVSWDGSYEDAYSIDIETGDRQLIAQAIHGFGGATLSRDGGWVHWWDGVDRDWKAASMTGGPVMSLTADLDVAFHNELDDHPDEPPPYGRAVWTEGDEALIVYDRFDAWRTDPTAGSAPVRLTNGRESNTRYRVAPVSDGTGGGGGGNFFGFGFGGGGGVEVPNGEVMMSTFDLATRGGGYAMGRTDQATAPRQMASGDLRYGRPTRARDAERMMWTRESFVEFPDVWMSDLEFAGAEKLTDANPQQAEYRWGDTELVSWTSADRTPLEGILIKPDGFDPSQKYPMMVYFYERSTDGMHAYRAPVPSRASIQYSFYASRGYLVFVPDIPYEIGYPGESALDAVVPGVLSLVEAGFVDADRIGVQGHSWGGYQIAYMITKTDLFAAAEAGAPVSNMTSAYGGIRWQSGMSRMFQYEKTQSRIGGTLWDERDRYIHNSPIFFADKINTPLLMLHNDEDGAVPWYQGIEMFVAMRRLQKPVFMLNYNGEAHGLTQKKNQTDFTIRMQQFFDHYLLDAPEPEWMSDGIPAVDKGKNMGLKVKRSATSAQDAPAAGGTRRD